MVREIKYNPCFQDITDDLSYKFFECVNKKIIYGHVAYFINDNIAIIHFMFDKFSVTNLKKALLDWELFKNMLVSHGVREIATLHNLNSGNKWDRFIKLFGFNEPIIIKMANRSI